MMATVALSSSSLLPLLECLEDEKAGVSEQTDSYLTIANRLSGEDGRQFLPLVVKHFTRLGKMLQAHIGSENVELSQAALQALGFCVFNTNIVAAIPEKFAEDVLSTLASLVVKSTDKNICTRALWVISKQNFPSEVVARKTPEILKTLEAVRTRDIQSVVMEHEALNVIIRLQEQSPTQMGEGAVFWAKLVVPLVVHSASKVRLRAAAAMELGMPLLLEKQQEVALIIEPMMSSKLIPELQKLFASKNETNVLKLWPLFVRLLGKMLHRGGSFINSLLYLEELGFRSSSPSIKKIAFIAWKSLIDNFALNPDILCSTKRLKLLMQPLVSIHVKTEALLLTKLEVWWYLVLKLGPNLATNFEQVGLPLLQNTLSSELASPTPSTPARGSSLGNGSLPITPKSGLGPCPSPAPTMDLNSSTHAAQGYPSIQLLGLEMLLHYFQGPEVTAVAAKNKLQLNLEPLTHPLLSGPSSFSKHAPALISAVRDGFIAIGKDAPDALLGLIWKSLVGLVRSSVEAVGNKKERPGSEVLTQLLQALQAIISSEALPSPRALALLEATVKGIPQKVLGSAAYQVANMDVLNGTPALFLLLLFYNSSKLSSYVTDERFFLCLETLVSCGLCGPTSALAFGEAVLGAIGNNVDAVENKEHLWRMWSIVVNPLTDTITQTNEVNQGDALEHNFSALHSALMFPVTHLLTCSALPQMTQKSVLSTWSRVYTVFARCSALVATAEENVCCEELCVKMAAILDDKALANLSTLEAVVNILQVIIESLDFSPYKPQFQQKTKSPRTPRSWVRKRNKALGNLTTYNTLLLQVLQAFLALDKEVPPAAVNSLGNTLISIISTVFTNIALPAVIHEVLASLVQPITSLYGLVGSLENEQSKNYSALGPKLEKLLGDILGSLQTRTMLQFDDELLARLAPLLCVLFPHKSRQIRSLLAQFWNGTFGNSLALTYPEELKPILSQVKQKTPIILPGFQAVDAPDDISGPYSNECSQLETKFSGVTVTPAMKRDSLLSRASELKERSSGTSKPVSVKLDFGSPKPPRREMLEEEASVDFVFIPPETKERVLTEHQKEVKRTKRVDIPAMYNNLDASLDTTVFTQYTQSQQDSMDMLPADEEVQSSQKDTTEKKDAEKSVIPQEATVGSVKESQDCVSSPEPKPPVQATKEKASEAEEISSPSSDVTMKDAAEQDDTKEDDDSSARSKEENSLNASGSSDIISGTPQKPNSRRQSFITLEKYSEGKPASPVSVTRFTGPLTRGSGKQGSQKGDPRTPVSSQTEKEAAKNISSRGSHQEIEEETAVADLNTSKASIQGMEDVDDVIPDTQGEVRNGASDPGDSSAEKGTVSEEQNSEENSAALSGSQASSQGEVRRSGRRRSRPLRPGEDPDDVELLIKPREKPNPQNRSSMSDSEMYKSSPSTQNDSMSQSRSRQRIKPAAEGEQLEGENTPCRTDPQMAGASEKKNKELVQTEISKEPITPEPKSESQDKTPSQSQTRRGRRSKMAKDSQGQLDQSQREELSHTDSQMSVSSDTQKNGRLVTAVPVAEVDSQSQGRPRRTRRSEAAESQDGDKRGVKEPGGNTQAESQPTPTSIPGRGRRRRKAEEDSRMSSNSSPVVSLDSEVSQEELDGTGSSQVPGGRKTRRSSQVALTTVENMESDASDSREDKPKPSKRGRKRKSLAEVIVSPPSQEMVQESVKHKESSSALPEIPIENSQKVEPEEGSHTVESQSVEIVEPDTSSEILEETPKKIETEMSSEKAQIKASPSSKSGNKEEVDPTEETQFTSDSKLGESEDQRGAEMEVAANEVELKSLVSTKTESKDTNSSSHDPATVPGKPEPKTQTMHKCPHNVRGRGRRRSRPCNCHLTVTGTSSQEGDKSDSQDTQDLLDDRISEQSGKLATDSEPLNLTPESVKQDDDKLTRVCSVSVVNMLGAPVISNEHLKGAPSTESPTEKCDLILLQSSEEKEGSVQPAHEGKSQKSENETEEQLVEKEEQQKVASDPEEEQQQENTSAGQEEGSCGQGEDELEITSSEPESAENISSCHERTESSVAQQALTEELPEKETEMPKSAPGDAEPSDDGVERFSALSKGSELNSAPAMEKDEEEDTQIDDEDLSAAAKDTGDQPSELPAPAQTSFEEICLDSPPKQKALDSVCEGADLAQSPIGGRTRGVWSPSASPSTSILKKCQKRPFEEESPSPLLKSRRVSFANPIHQQEVADDIDRRSPIIRTSSPRIKIVGGQHKYITTPTKGRLKLSPRNLHSPIFRSSKKCLMSEMSQEPRPIVKDCVYPALVSCSAPVEAVLPKISSNMWPRGFGQLVRSRNIKTVGDLSALTLSDIKMLPIRSPKLSNVKKALRMYHEIQRKGRSDDLKSFEEMEKMTSEPEEVEDLQHPDEEPAPAETQEVPLEASSGLEEKSEEMEEQTVEEQTPEDLLSQLEVLGARLGPGELSRCSPRQLALMLDHLGGMSRNVVAQLQSHLSNLSTG